MVNGEEKPKATEIGVTKTDEETTRDIEAIIQERINEALRGYITSQTTANPPNAVQTPSASVAHIAVKLPPLMTQDPRVWLQLAESQFAIAGITREITKFHHLVSALSDRIASDVIDVITGPKSEKPYSDLSKAIVERFCESDGARIHQLLHGAELGDMKPSQLLRKLKRYGGTNITDKFLKEIWLKRLPMRAQEILTPSADALELAGLAELADRLLETMTQSHINAIAPAPLSTNTPCSSVSPTESGVATQISEIIQRLDKVDLTLKANNASRNTRGRERPRFNPRNQSRSPSPAHSHRSGNHVIDAQGVCFYHSRFRDAARNCRPDCHKWAAFKAEN